MNALKLFVKSCYLYAQMVLKVISNILKLVITHQIIIYPFFLNNLVSDYKLCSAS